jgi:hypothetical protein
MFIASALIASSLSRGVLHLRYNEKYCNARVAVFLKPYIQENSEQDHGGIVKVQEKHVAKSPPGRRARFAPKYSRCTNTEP